MPLTLSTALLSAGSLMTLHVARIQVSAQSRPSVSRKLRFKSCHRFLSSVSGGMEDCRGKIRLTRGLVLKPNAYDPPAAQANWRLIEGLGQSLVRSMHLITDERCIVGVGDYFSTTKVG
jgi:hypothetical protein